MSEKRPMTDILNEAGMEARQTKYGGHQAVYLHPSASVAAACDALGKAGYKVALSYDSSWPVLRDVTVRYNALGQVMK